MRVALHACVSTSDKDQNPENQLVLLRREAERAGDTIYATPSIKNTLTRSRAAIPTARLSRK